MKQQFARYCKSGKERQWSLQERNKGRLVITPVYCLREISGCGAWREKLGGAQWLFNNLGWDGAESPGRPYWQELTLQSVREEGSA